ncbi:hypothetical protein EV700_0806 [Fluviicoccus keumensis]|uniref:START domain-containing protein n=1 Tax=Fluviicoccus keumensis TaxID=1435465 RepID=A0A4Q7ZD63_9GAMM|nr:hypothetical protein [Fluviicoccus keumensis]RZU47839.1 hypothetical protein EV700_0806 [Fluviicoccus keumensis]
MRFLQRLLGVCLTLCFSLGLAHAAATGDDDLDELRDKLGNQWVLLKNDRLRSIKTWIKQEDDKQYRSFRVEATLNGDVETYTRVMLDADNFSKWYWEVLESKMLKRVSATEYYIYLKHRAPIGQPNRDVILHAVFEPQSGQNKTLVMRVNAAPGYLPEKPKLVRMPAEDMTVKVTPLPGNKVQLEAEGYVDPGGNVPNWAINYIQRSAPYSIMLGLQRMMLNPEYARDNSPRGNLPFQVLSAR